MPQLATYGEKVPVTVITGFLGSGKSTLLNYLLGSAPEKHICVIENEFGEVNIDKTLVGDNLGEKEDLVSLENGCVCCSLRRDIVRAFSELGKRAKSRGRPMDHILLETTGLADPSPVAFTFFANPWIAARFRLDSIVCVVDAKHLLQHLEDHKPQDTVNEAVQQLAFADLILLNKVDLVSDSQRADVTMAIKRINNSARLMECQLNEKQGQPAVKDILGTNTFSVQRALMVDPQFMDTDSDSEVDAPQEQAGAPQQLLQPAATASASSKPDAAQQPGIPAVSPSPAQPAGQEEHRAVRAQAGPRSASEAAEQQGPASGRNEAETAACGTTAASAEAGRGPVVVGAKRQVPEADSTTGPGSSAPEKKPRRRHKKLHDLSDISSVGITTRGQLDEYRFNMFMRDLLAEKAADIFRCKGVLSVHGYGRKKFVFQGVHETICYGPAEHPWAAGEVPLNQIVFIGRGLDRKMLVEGFRTCLWQQLPEGWHQATDPATKQVYYWHTTTGEKSWERPVTTSNNPELTTHHATTQQPAGVAPRDKSHSQPTGSRTNTCSPAPSGGLAGYDSTGAAGSGAEAAGGAAPPVAVA